MDKLTTSRGESKSPRSRLIKIAEVVGKVGVSAVPIPPLVSEVAKLGLEKIFAYVRQRDEQRILEFYRAFLYRNEMPDADILAAEVEENNFHALLNACVSDIEEEKVVPYANLTRSIALGRVNIELRRHFILTLRDLSWEELDLLRRIYVVNAHPVVPKTGREFEVAHLLTYMPNEISETLAVTSLRAKGMLEGDNISRGGKSFIEACSNADDLEPSVYGYRVWSKHTCLILHLSGKRFLNIEREKLAEALRSSCIYSHSVTATGVIGTGYNDPLFRFGTDCCVILIDKDYEFTSDSLGSISKLAETNTIIQVFNNREAIDDDPLVRLPMIRVDPSKEDTWSAKAVDLLLRELNQQEQSCDAEN